MRESIIVIMAKKPLVGWTKTRLFPAYTPEEAAALYEALLRDSIDLAMSLAETDLAVAMSPPDSILYFNDITPPDSLLVPVTGADIGEVLEKTFESLFKVGYRQVIAFNSDGPSLPQDYLHQALRLLGEHDVVFGPGLDGGYYLIGLNRFHRPLFHCINWSSGTELEQSRQRARAIHLSVAETPPWYDVDTPADAWMLSQELKELPPERLAHTRRFFAACPPREIPPV